MGTKLPVYCGISKGNFLAEKGGVGLCQKTTFYVMPAKAGIQGHRAKVSPIPLDASFRRHDVNFWVKR
jgi:hypothetical protein